MEKKYHYLILFFMVFSFPRNAVSAISLEFDSQGNLLSSDSGRIADFSTTKTSNFAVPEGVELRKDIAYEFYPVFGKTFSEIVRSVEENGPVDKTTNSRMKTRLDWSLGLSFQIDYSYGVDEDENKVHAAVDILDIGFNYHIKITLPTLLDDTPLNPIEKKLWRNYLQRLLENEYERAAIIRGDNFTKTAIESIKEVNYFIFDYRGDSAVERTVISSLREDATKIVREMIKKINDRLNDHDKTAGKGSRLF